MGITIFYRSLGVTLKSPRQSWGGVHPDGTLYLSVWKEDLKKVNGKRSVRLLLPPEKHWGPTTGRGSHGYQQRRRHIERIRNGARCYCVLRWGRDTPRERGTVRKFLLIGGEVHEDNEGTLLVGSSRKAGTLTVPDRAM